MPVYEYFCGTCNSRFEKLRPMSEGSQAKCPECGAESPRVLSVFAAVTRGSDGDSACIGGCGGCACGGSGACACSSAAGF